MTKPRFAEQTRMQVVEILRLRARLKQLESQLANDFAERLATDGMTVAEISLITSAITEVIRP